MSPQRLNRRRFALNKRAQTSAKANPVRILILMILIRIRTPDLLDFQNVT